MSQGKKKQRPLKNTKKKASKIANPSSKSQNLPIILAVLAITFIAFIPSLQNGFVNWDDPDFVSNNLQIRSLANIPAIFTNTVLGAYAPLVFTSYAIEYQLFELNPFYYHLDNLLLHLACVFLVFWIGLQLNLSLWAAALLATLFGIHPMRVESVAWITERKDVLYGIFYLGAIFQYIKYIKTKEQKHLWLALGLFVPSLFSKIQAVALPLSFLALDYYFKRPMNLKLIWEKIPFFGLSLIIGLLGIYFLSTQEIVIEGVYSLFQSLIIGTYSLMTYLAKWLVPYPLVTLYEYPNPDFNFDWHLYISLPIIIAFFGGLFYLFKKDYRKIFFGFLFFLLNVIFMLQVVGVGQGYLADRYTYIPYFGLFFIMGYGFDYFTKTPKYKKIAYLTTAFMLGIFAILTWQQNKVWKNGETLWSKVINHYPKSAVAHQNRADYFREESKFAQAAVDYKAGLAIDPKDVSLYKNYGKLLYAEGKIQEAINIFNKGLAEDASEGDLYLNRGAAYAANKQFTNAIQDLNKAIELSPNEMEAYLNRSNVYFETRQFDLSIADLDIYLAKNPTNAREWFKKGLMLNAKGDANGALAAYNQAIINDDQDGTYFMERSRVYETLGDAVKSASDRQRAQQLGVQ